MSLYLSIIYIKKFTKEYKAYIFRFQVHCLVPTQIVFALSSLIRLSFNSSVPLFNPFLPIVDDLDISQKSRPKFIDLEETEVTKIKCKICIKIYKISLNMKSLN